MLYKYEVKWWNLPGRFHDYLRRRFTYIYSFCFSSMEDEAPHRKAKHIISTWKATKFMWIVNKSEQFRAAGQWWNCDCSQSWTELSVILHFFLAHKIHQIIGLCNLWQYSPRPKIFSSISIWVTWILSYTVLNVLELGWTVAPAQQGGSDTTGVSLGSIP